MKQRTLAIIGNPNSGKTTLFNRLTGSNQHVGNWPGVTVDRKSGHLTIDDTQIEIVDLPGIYSLSPYTEEEIIGREYVLSDEPDGILNIVDATNLERNLYLTMQLLAMGLPMTIAVNFIDDVEAQGIRIDCDRLSALLGVPVVAVSAKRGIGMDTLKQTLANGMHPPREQPNYQHGVGTAIAHVAFQLEQMSGLRPCSSHFYAQKLLEGDPILQKSLSLPPEMQAQVDVMADALHSHDTDDDNEMILADALYDFIERVSAQAVKQPAKRILTISERIDRVVLKRWLAMPIFALVMILMFWTTFGPIGAGLGGLIEHGISEVLSPWVEQSLTMLGASAWAVSLVCDGVIGGVGGILVFLPQIVLLFFFLSLLEDTGYLARIAFIMDTLLRRIGLSGKSFVPMLMGFGCTTPAVMAARTMENEQTRRMTILLTPFMSCGAKLPVYGLVAGALFGGWSGVVIVGIYVFGLVMSIVVGFILKKTMFRDMASGFVLELPPYRMPSTKGTLRNMWDKAKDFLTKAGTVIFLMSLVIWVFQYFTLDLTVAATPAESMLGSFGKLIAPAFAPLGFADWRAVVALLTGLIAKEAVVSTMSVLYGAGNMAALGGMLGSVFSPAAGLAFLVFTLLYMPCMSAFATIKREMGGWKWAIGMAVGQTALAWCVGAVVYLVANLLV